MTTRHTCISFMVLSAAASALIIDEPNIGISKRIPKRGDSVTWSIPVLNDADQAFNGAVTLSMHVARRGEPLALASRQGASMELEPGVSDDVVLSWRPERNGQYRFVFEIEGLDQRAVRDLAVTEKDVYFVWFGAPKDFRWCNVPTTVKPEDRDWWSRRGAIPAQWKGGVCYKQWPLERFVESWGDTDWIAIDEVGGPGEITDTFISAWKQLRQSKPNQFVAVWFMGAHAYWTEIKDLVDLFVPEIYLNYRNNHLGQFDAYLRTARAAGVMDQVIPGLGINQVKSKDKKRVITSPTEADVLRQIRHLKRTAPELNGVGFFTSYTCAWGVAEYADRLCGEYYVRPVVTIRNPDRPIRLTPAATTGRRTATMTIANAGGMDAENVVVEWHIGDRNGGSTRRCTRIDRVPCGGTTDVALEFSQEHGWLPVEARIVPDEDCTILDGRAATVAVRLPETEKGRRALILPVGVQDAVTGVWFAEAGEGSPGSATLVDQALRPLRQLPCAALPPRPGRERENLVALGTASLTPEARVVLLQSGGSTPASAPEHRCEGNLLHVRNAYFEAELDLATDTLIRLNPVGAGGNLFKRGWAFAAKGHEGFAEATIVPGTGSLVVTVPYASESAHGESQYVFLTHSPAIRIARSWRPRGEVTMKTAAERCHLHQRGGTFALQAGVGAKEQRGRLHDGEAYRDLLFGYLGERPGPDNADRAGWIDFSYGESGIDGGMGVIIDYRWPDSDSKSYDVTRLYDARDWLEVLFLWGREKTFARPKEQLHLPAPAPPPGLHRPGDCPACSNTLGTRPPATARVGGLTQGEMQRVPP